jgi:hypothetical protein
MMGEALDPIQYAQHVTRTAMLLEQLARDVHALREQMESGGRGTEALRVTVGQVEREFAVFKTQAQARMDGSVVSVTGIEERLRWLSRLVIGSLVTGILGGAIALVFRALS